VTHVDILHGERVHMRTIGPVLTPAAVASLLAQTSSSYRITHTYILGGEGSWDYVVSDSPHHRLFIARQNRVVVVDENSGKLLGEVTGINGAHGTAVAEPLATDSLPRVTISRWSCST
jgi:hypothetical protein